jgi:hypothetical protein
MALKFSYTRPDGGVSIVHAVPKVQLERLFGPMTDEQYEAHVRTRSIPPDAIDVTKLPVDWTPPEDRTFRDAWKHDKGNVTIDLAKAKAIAAKLANVPEQALAAAKNTDDLRKLLPAKG